MLDLTPAFFAFAVPAVIFSGMSKGGFGGGAAFAASAILALYLPPPVALGLMLPLLMLMDVTALPGYWRRWSWADAAPMLMGALPGVLLGALLMKHADPDVFRLLIGVICIAFVAWRLAQGAGLIRLARIDQPHRGFAGASGMAVGFTSFISHAGGPPAAVYLLSRGLDKMTYQATTVLLFWAVNLMKVGFYAGAGVFSLSTLTADLILAPVAMVGVVIGIKAHKVVSEKLFFGITYTLLTFTGIRLIWVALA